MGPIGCPETSVRNYHYSLRNNPEEGNFQLHRCSFPVPYDRDKADLQAVYNVQKKTHCNNTTALS